MGRVVRCDKLRDGGVEVEFSSEVDAKRALSATSFTYTVKDKGERREVKLPIVGRLNRCSPISQVWSQVKQISGRFSAHPLPVLQLRGQDILNPTDVANEIARAFAVRCGTANADPQFLRLKSRSEANPVDFATSEQLTYNEPFSLAELRSAVTGLRSVAEGPDEVHNDMLRRLPSTVLGVLLAVFNRLWQRGEFPAAWREAIVLPILKPGKSGTDPLHYRPISLTSSLCKLMERLVNVRLSWFLESNDILSPAQCGFRRNRGTLDHLVSLDTENGDPNCF